MTQALLLVEDDPVLGRGLQINLELEGFQVEWAKDLATARIKFEANPSFRMLILDLNLPDGNGLSLLREVRKKSNLPVIILTARTEEESVVEGLQAGANDYVRKPFGNRELMARIRATLKDLAVKNPNEIHVGDLLLSKQKRRCYFKEAEIDLNRREFDILSYMMENVDAVITRDNLLQFLNTDGEVFDRTIDSHISHIRAKLRKSNVQTVHINSVYGVGYRLEKLNEKPAEKLNPSS
jgi:two-component system OmpR family response regulator